MMVGMIIFVLWIISLAVGVINLIMGIVMQDQQGIINGILILATLGGVPAIIAAILKHGDITETKEEEFQKRIREEKIPKQKAEFFELLKKYHVPDDYHKMIVSDNNYHLEDCPAVVWIENEKVKFLIINPPVILLTFDVAEFNHISIMYDDIMKDLDARGPKLYIQSFDVTKSYKWLAMPEYIQDEFVQLNPASKMREYQEYHSYKIISEIVLKWVSFKVLYKLLNKPIDSYLIDDYDWYTTDKIGRIKNCNVMRWEGIITNCEYNKEKQRLVTDYLAQYSKNENKYQRALMELYAQNVLTQEEVDEINQKIIALEDSSVGKTHYVNK
ncbi:MAG: hypothetical protein RR954_06020 [Christensenellaceae bacterium]